MIQIAGVSANAIQRLKAQEPARSVQQQEEPQERPQKPAVDEYIPEEKQEPAGQYWLGQDEEGNPKIYFDDPERESSQPQTPKSPEADGPENSQKANGRKVEICRGSTDEVDREIEKLKKKQKELEQQLGAETDPDRAKELERQLAQVEGELRQKDNDTYRRQHTKFY